MSFPAGCWFCGAMLVAYDAPSCAVTGPPPQENTCAAAGPEPSKRPSVHGFQSPSPPRELAFPPREGLERLARGRWNPIFQNPGRCIRRGFSLPRRQANPVTRPTHPAPRHPPHFPSHFSLRPTMPPITSPKDRLRLAIQKSGRLSTDSLDLLKSCGIRVKSPKEKLLLHAENFPIDILFVRDDDIPQLVMDGVCDLGIVGTNVLEEAALERRTAGTAGGYFVERPLDFGGCRLAIALPEEKPYASARDLQGTRIATSYPYLTKRYREEENSKAEVITLSASVEIAPRLGLTNIICDLLSSRT